MDVIESFLFSRILVSFIINLSAFFFDFPFLYFVLLFQLSSTHTHARADGAPLTHVYIYLLAYIGSAGHV